MRIAHFGTFDVENYGDLLFPLVLERRMAGRGHQLVHVSPLGGGAVWGDCVETISTQDARTGEFDGVIIGGGHLIHAQPSDVPAYRDADDRGLFANADLWLGSTLRAGELGIPIVWNAPGVPGPLPPEAAALLRWAAGQAAYVSVRDEASGDFLARTGFEGEVVVVLDTAIEVSRLWSDAELDTAWRNTFRSRGHPVPERAFAVHFNARFLSDGIAETAARLDALSLACKTTPILLALGPCHGDATLQRQISQAMSVPHCLIDAPQSLREVAACIRGADLYVGSSLHGAVTARAFDRPAVVVAPEVVGGHAKFSQFLAAHARLLVSDSAPVSGHVDSWGEAWARTEALLVSKMSEPTLRDEGGDDRDDHRLQEAVESHWGRLLSALEGRSPDGRPIHRAELAGFASLCTSRWQREMAYAGVLLDQAREAAKSRETAQKSSQRFRELERNYRDLKETVRIMRSGSRRSVSAFVGHRNHPATILDPGAGISLKDARSRLSAGEFAFVDAGCGAGGSIEHCERLFRKGTGIGFDLSKDKIAIARAAGHVVCQADLASVRLPSQSVHFVTFLDFLEHLPDLDRTRDVLANLALVARDFLFIRHPNFEDTEYLISKGLKLDWTDWSGHTNPMTLAEIDLLVRQLDLPSPTVLGQKPIVDSRHPSVIPVSAPCNTVGYDAGLHGPKETIRFDRRVYAQFDIFVRLNAALSDAAWSRITSHVVSAASETQAIDRGEWGTARGG